VIADETDWVPRAVAEREAARADRAEAKAARLMARFDDIDEAGIQVYDAAGRYHGSTGAGRGVRGVVAFLAEWHRQQGTGGTIAITRHGEPLATIRDAPGGPVVEWAEGQGPGKEGGS
jgi:hypothetical protein